MTTIVKRISRTKPDMLCVEVWDAPFTKYPLVPLETVDASFPTENLVTRTNPHTGLSGKAYVIGSGMWLKFLDEEPATYMDRVAAGNVANYSAIGSASPTAVYVYSQANDQGITETSGGSMQRRINCRHQIFIQYDGALPEGTFTMSNSGGAFPSTSFELFDRRVHCNSIRATQTGYKPSDPVKTASLSIWIPEYGTNGVVDLDTLHTVVDENFYIIDDQDATQYTGTITLRKGPTDVEASETLTKYMSTTDMKLITGITKGSPTTFTIANHGISNGEERYFFGVAGLNNLFRNNRYTVTVTGTDTFTVAVDTTSASNWSQGAYRTGFADLCCGVFSANKAATYVYGMDFSDFVPTSYGKYRVYVPGFGVSWPFRIDPAHHYEMAKLMVKGYTSQCWGMSLNSGITGGWNRPANFRQGKNGQIVYESKVPACADGESGYEQFGINKVDFRTTPWTTTTPVTDWFGCWSDAGDWDWHIRRHVPELWLMLDVAYDRVDAGRRDLFFGFPKSSQTIGSLYAAIDDLPDVIHMAIWYLDPFRRTQNANGSVYSGCYYKERNGEGREFQPSWLNPEPMYIEAADHIATFVYAAAAAKLGRLIKAAGYTTLGDMWIDSAEDAWTWAEAIYQDYDSANIAGTAFVAHYLTNLDFQTNAGFTDAQLKTGPSGTTGFDILHTNLGYAKGFRILAAASLWRAKGGIDDAYNTIIKAYGSFGTSTFDQWGGWEYLNGPDLSDNTSVRTSILNGLDDIPVIRFADQVANNYAYIFGDVVGPARVRRINQLFWAYEKQIPAGNFNRWRDLLFKNLEFIGGANQNSLCCYTGIGENGPTAVLHRDREWANLDASDAPGFVVYGWSNIDGTVRVNNFSDENAFNYIIERPVTADGEAQAIYPVNPQIPYYETHYRNTFCVTDTEFVTQESIVGTFMFHVFAHTWDDTGTTTLTNAPISASLSF